MQDEKSGLSHIMQEVWPIVYQRDGEHAAHQNEWTQLQHKNKEARKTSCSPLLPTGPHHEGPANMRRFTGVAHSAWIFTLTCSQYAVSTWVESG